VKRYTLLVIYQIKDQHNAILRNTGLVLMMISLVMDWMQLTPAIILLLVLLPIRFHHNVFGLLQLIYCLLRNKEDQNNNHTASLIPGKNVFRLRHHFIICSRALE